MNWIKVMKLWILFGLTATVSFLLKLEKLNAGNKKNKLINPSPAGN